MPLSALYSVVRPWSSPPLSFCSVQPRLTGKFVAPCSAISNRVGVNGSSHMASEALQTFFCVGRAGVCWCEPLAPHSLALHAITRSSAGSVALTAVDQTNAKGAADGQDMEVVKDGTAAPQTIAVENAKEADKRAIDAEQRTRTAQEEAAIAKQRAADAEKKAEEAEKKAEEAEKRRNDVEQEKIAAEKKAADAEKRAADAEKKAADAEKRAQEAGKETAANHGQMNGETRNVKNSSFRHIDTSRSSCPPPLPPPPSPLPPLNTHARTLRFTVFWLC